MGKKKKKNNIPIKVLAAIFAIILWVYVMNEVNPIIDKEISNIPVSYIGLQKLDQSNIMLMEPKEATISVKVSGRRDQVLTLNEKDMLAEVDLEGYKEGKYKIPVKVQGKGNVEEIVDFNPKEILFEFNEVIEKQMTVNVNTKGSLKTGFILGTPTVKPVDVLLKGPSSWINGVDKVAAAVNVEGMQKDIHVNVPITVKDAKGQDVNGIEKNISHVDIVIPVYKTKEVPIKVETTGKVSSGYEVTNITVEPNTIAIKGKSEIVDSITEISTKEVSLNGIRGSKYITDVELNIPEGVSTVNETNKVNAQIQVEKVEMKSFYYNSQEIKIKNLSSDYIVSSIFPEKVQIQVQGPESALGYVSSKYITPYVEADELVEGKYTLELKADDLYKVSISSIIPNVVEIEIQKNAKPASVENEKQDVLKEKTKEGMGGESTSSLN